MTENPYTEQRRQQKRNGNNEKDDVIKMSSNVKNFEDIKWDRNTNNPFIDNFDEYEDQVGGSIKIGDQSYSVRMPMRKLIKKFDWVKRNYNPETEEVVIKKTKENYDRTISLEDVQEEIIEDMIIGFDLENPGLRMDDIIFNYLSSFCWHFYNFFSQKSRGQQSVQFSTKKG